MTLLAGIAVPSSLYTNLAAAPAGIVLAADTRLSWGRGTPSDDDGLKIVPVGEHSLVGMRGDVRLLERAFLQLARIFVLLSTTSHPAEAPEQLLRDLLRRSWDIENAAVEAGERVGPVHPSTALLATRIPTLTLWRFDSDEGFAPSRCETLTSAGDGAPYLAEPFETHLADLTGSALESSSGLHVLSSVFAAAIRDVIESQAASTVGGSVVVATLGHDSPPQFPVSAESRDGGASFEMLTAKPGALRTISEVLGSPLREPLFAPTVRRLQLVTDFEPPGTYRGFPPGYEFTRGAPFEIHGAILVTVQAGPSAIEVPVRYLWEGPLGPIPIFQPSRAELLPRLASRFDKSPQPGAIPALVVANTVSIQADGVTADMILVRLDFPCPGEYSLRAIVDERDPFVTPYSVRHP